ncbi:ABC transporter ATP-binding protein [Alkaliphilus peptidifermentans]|uniref:Putative ABC transport system ATP-binding protein n=1 Tax=Alkaliphilus peptidifermentans DSM 18978 TaxID=1120976 RepID=A0A1G5J4B5_9FIRM|nr:phosphate ABC transporter ATP-binding protein [Alkaliphilus peptidifermentans]SCY83024.1 putative ABC transport system ATP-binding protein [Alkaliphilus peptidifermentans DSM 18978]
MISIKNLYIKRETQEILKDVSLKIVAGEFVNIMGPSGGGKSTLLRTLNGLESFDEGTIDFNNKNIMEIDPIRLRQEISYVFQIPYLFGDKVRENIEYPLKLHKKPIQEKKISKLLENLNLTPDILEKNCKDLSGGEQQRICLLRSIILEPKVILLDEITSSLDPINTKLVEDFIKKTYELQQPTVILVTHSVEQAKRMGNRTVFLHEGKVKLDTTTESFFLDPKEEYIKEFIG